MTKIIRFSKNGEINPERVKVAVYNRITFEIEELMWYRIDGAFAECWNDVIGIRGWVHEGQIEQYIYNSLLKQNVNFDYEKIVEIVKIIFDYISMTDGFLDND